MPYTAQISRLTPSAFLFLIDQSGSMAESMDTGQTKAQFVADVLNRTIYQLIIRSTRSDGVRNYFDVGVVAYGSEGARSGFQGSLAGSGEVVLHPLTAIESSPLRVEDRVKRVPDGAGGLVDQATKFPVWFDPASDGGTPMCAAMQTAGEVLTRWCAAHPESHPPTVIHVTDGASTDGDPSEIAENVKLIKTNDGSCLLFNMHISDAAGQEVVFPENDRALDDYGKLLFRASSAFPPHLMAAARAKGYDNITQSSRFFGYKAGYEAIVDFFDIGTVALNMA
jgi:hypothetical protein